MVPTLLAGRKRLNNRSSRKMQVTIMSTYKMEDGTIVKTQNAIDSWPEATRWNGNNHISVATGSQWDHETLYLSRKGRYYIESESQWQGSTPSAQWVSEHAAAQWLLSNNYELPVGLSALEEEICE